MCIGETLWVPLCTYEHPNGVLIPVPVGGRLRYVSFCSRTVIRRLPGSLTTLRVVPDPYGSGITLRLTRTRVYVQFWPFWLRFKSFCAAAFWPKLYGFFLFFSLTGPLRDRYHTPVGVIKEKLVFLRKSTQTKGFLYTHAATSWRFSHIPKTN